MAFANSINMTTLQKTKLELEGISILETTVEALLLQFRNKIVRGLNLPSPYLIKEVLEEIRREQDERLQERVKEGLQKILERVMTGPELSQTYLEDYMLNLFSPYIEWQWVQWYGDLFKFQPGERKKAEARVKAYWSKDELQDFRAIGKIMRERAKQKYEKRIKKRIIT
jgi:hypothetical protein